MPATDLSTRLFDYAQFSNHGSNMDPWFANQKGIMPRSMSAGMLLKEAMKRDERRPRPTDYHVGYNKEKPYASRKIGPFIPFEGRPEDKVAPRYALGFRENGGEIVNVVGPTARRPAPRGVNAVLRERLPRDAPINAASVRPDSKHGPGDYDPPIPGRAARAPTLYRTPRSGKVGGGNKLQAQVPPVGAYFLPFEPGQVRVIPGIPNAPGHHGRRFQRLPEGEVGGADGEGGDIFGPSPSTPMNVGPGAYNVADSFDRDAAKKLKLGELRDALAKLKSTLPPVTRAPTMMETHTPRPTFVHEAGDFRLPGDEVQANTPGVLPQLPPGERNRRVLAEWLVSPQHPLTARVAVNRSWQEFFGAGIVATPGDFGVRGATPSHPRLLDWLASELMHRRWSTKQLHRTLVTSSTYRQQVASGAASDAERQRWLAGQRPLRLSAEQIRDSVLRVSGLWDARIGGPSVRPPQPASVSEQGYQNSWQVSSGGNRYRRSLYTWVQRTSPFAMHITFDAPNPNQICTRRERSNTPLQALTLLNGPFFFEAAGALAQQSANAEPDDERARIHYLYQRVLSRPPTVDELSVLLELINQLRADANSDADQDPWPVVCSVLLNLHEFVTRG